MISQDDDELERKLNGPGAIAAATASATSSSSRRHSRAGMSDAARAAPQTHTNSNTLPCNGGARSIMVQPEPDMKVGDGSFDGCKNTLTIRRSGRGANDTSMAATTNTADDAWDLDDSLRGVAKSSRFDSSGLASVERDRAKTTEDLVDLDDSLVSAADSYKFDSVGMAGVGRDRTETAGDRHTRDLTTFVDDLEDPVPEEVYCV